MSNYLKACGAGWTHLFSFYFRVENLRVQSKSFRFNGLSYDKEVSYLYFKHWKQGCNFKIKGVLVFPLSYSSEHSIHWHTVINIFVENCIKLQTNDSIKWTSPKMLCYFVFYASCLISYNILNTLKISINHEKENEHFSNRIFNLFWKKKKKNTQPNTNKIIMKLEGSMTPSLEIHMNC